MSSQTTRQLAAIMFTDMVGYTALMQQNEQLAIQKRDRSKKIIEDSLARCEGKLLQYYGDGTLSIFSSALNSVRCAIEMQTLFLAEPKIEVRIGIHTGDVMMDDNGVYGDSVNVASRIESLATPGGIFISEKLFDEVKNSEGISTKSLGYFELKNVKQPMQVYAITNPGIVIPSRDELRGKTKTALNGIAVLPFVSLSSDPENEFFCDGITEELINVLAQVDGLQVTSRTSTFVFKGRNEDVREIAAKLNVQKLIEGSVRKAGSKVRITAQLINAADGYHIWSAAYDRGIEDIFAVQDEIARAIANKLRINLSTEEHESQISEAPTENLEAYKKYLQGVLKWDSVQMNVRMSSVELLKEAVALDPNFANAHALLATIYSFPGIMGTMDANEAKRLAVYHAERAFKAQPENPKALAALATVKFANWDWDAAHELLLKANRINPSEPAVYFALGEYYMLHLDYDKLVEVAKRTSEVDPMSARTLAEAGRMYMFAGKPDEAEVLVDRSVVLNPENLLALQMKGFIAWMRNDFSKAIKIFEENQRMVGDHPYVLMGLVICYSTSGQIEKAQEIKQKFITMHKQHPKAGFDLMIGFIHLVLHELEDFYPLFDRAIEQKSTFMLQMYGDAFGKATQHDEHVIAARKKVGLPVFESRK